MREKRKDAEYVIRKIHIKPINVAIKHVTKSLQRIADMEAPTNFRQDDYTITIITINKGQTNTAKKWKGRLNILPISY